METGILEFIWLSIWNVVLFLLGSLVVYLSYKTHKQQKRLQKFGIKTSATIIATSLEKRDTNSSSIKVPVLEFIDHSNTPTTYVIKGRMNTSFKIGEVIPIYYNPEKPDKDYYIPTKEYLIKYVMLIIGLFFLILGLIYFAKDLNERLHFAANDFTHNYFLYLLISFFSIILLLILIVQLTNWGNKVRKSETK